MNQEEYNKNFLKNNEEAKYEESKIDKEYVELCKEYKKIFKRNIPRVAFPARITEEEIKQAIKKCLEIKEDKLLELLKVTIDNKLIY